MEWYYFWWPSLTSNRVVRVCQHQLSFLSVLLLFRSSNSTLCYLGWAGRVYRYLCVLQA